MQHIYTYGHTNDRDGKVTNGKYVSMQDFLNDGSKKKKVVRVYFLKWGDFLKKGKLFVCVTLVLIISTIFISCSDSNDISKNDSNDASKNIQVSISDKIVKTDLANDNVYSRAYNQYNLKNEYDYYTCIVKIENNSKSNVADVSFDKTESENFLIDYENDMFSPFFVQSNSVGYVTCIISVKKGISNEDLEKIPYQLPPKINLRFAEDVNDMNYVFSVSKEYTVCSDDFSKNDVQTHPNPV